MNDAAQRENARSLAEVIGSTEEEAAVLLQIKVAITVAPADAQCCMFAEDVQKLLSRTVSDVVINRPSTDMVSVELVLGSAQFRHEAPRVFATISQRRIFIGNNQLTHDPEGVPAIAILLASCYACAAVLKKALGERINYPTPDIFVVDLDELLGLDAANLVNEVSFGEVFLAGAGAIGNAFVLGLSKLPAVGVLHIVDDDLISAGNLQRCSLFSETDIGQSKSATLANVAESLLPKVSCKACSVRLDKVPQRNPGNWLRRLVVAVDSPRARRSLQAELPGEVFDASTTGVAEIVFHFHKQPTENACMSCVYHQSPEEDAHEHHVADSLGITLAQVREIRISSDAAQAICLRYPHLSEQAIVGLAYDTLFKQLCSTAMLFSPEGRQVLAPFAFVSTLAGAMLALEFFRRVQRGHDKLFNEWRISPWNNPVLRRRRVLPRNPDCEFCGNAVLRDVMAKLWG